MCAQHTFAVIASTVKCADSACISQAHCTSSRVYKNISVFLSLDHLFFSFFFSFLFISSRVHLLVHLYVCMRTPLSIAHVHHRCPARIMCTFLSLLSINNSSSSTTPWLLSRTHSHSQPIQCPLTPALTTHPMPANTRTHYPSNAREHTHSLPIQCLLTPAIVTSMRALSSAPHFCRLEALARRLNRHLCQLLLPPPST